MSAEGVEFVMGVCDAMKALDPEALVVASPQSFETGGHVTVVHATNPAMIDLMLRAASFRVERIDAKRVKVFVP